MKMSWLFGTVVLGSVAVTSAYAGSELQFDINSLTATASSAFSTSFTGTITLSDDVDTAMSDMLIDGVAQGIAAGQLGDFTGSITLVAGVVTGGSFTITDVGAATYTATITNGSGSVLTAPGSPGPGPFLITGLTFNGNFAGLAGGTSFAGVDVTAWSSVQPLSGSFLQFKFGPNVAGVDTNADMDIFVVVPLPTPVGLGGLGLVALATLRRRR